MRPFNSLEMLLSKGAFTIKKKSFARRHFILTFLFALVVLLVGSVAVLLWGGPVVTDLATMGAKKYLSGLAHLDVSFDKLSGNLFDGYVLEGVSVGSKTEPDVVTLSRAMVALDAKESISRKKAVLRAELGGLRVKEDKLDAVSEAAALDFPPSEEKPKDESGEPFPVFKYVLPQSFKAADLAGGMGWAVESLTVDLPDADKLLWDLSLSAEYQGEPIKLAGSAALSESAMPEGADLNVKVMDCDVDLSATLKDGLVALEKIDGVLFGSPVSGTASIDTSAADPAVAADIELRKVDLARLKKWVPDLGDSTIDGFAAKVSGTLSKPVGTVTLKNGNFAYQTYKVSNVNGDLGLDGKNASAKLSANAFGAKVDVNGSAELDPKGAVSASANVVSLDLAKVGAAVPQLSSLALGGTVSLSTDVGGTLDNPQVKAKATSPKLGAMGYAVSDLSTAVSATMEKAIIESLSLNAYGSKITASGSAGLTPDGALDMKANVASLDLAKVGAAVPQLNELALDGTVSLSADVGGTLGSPQVKAKVSSPKLGAMGYAASDIAAALSATMEKAIIESFSLNAYGAKLTASGSAGLTPSGALDLKANLSSLDLAKVSASVPQLKSADLKGVITASAAVGGTLGDPKASVSVSSPRVRAMKTYDISDIKAAVTASSKGADVEALSLKGFGGSVDASGKIGFAGGAVMDLHGKIKDFDLAQAVPGGTVKGIVNSDFDITGTATKPNVNFNAVIASLDAAQFGAKDITLKVDGNTALNVSLKGTTKFGTPFGGGGTVKLPLGGTKSALDLKFKLDKMSISELLPNTVKYSGDIAADVIVKGTFEKPKLSAKLRSDEFEASGYKLVGTQANAALNGQTVKFDASVAMGDRRPTVTGTVDFSKGLNCTVDVNADGVSVDALHPSLAGMVDGRVSLSAHGTVDDKGIDFSGRVTSPVVNVLLTSEVEQTDEEAKAEAEAKAAEEAKKAEAAKGKKAKNAKSKSSKKNAKAAAEPVEETPKQEETAQKKTVTKVAKLPIENILTTFKFKDNKISVPAGQVGLGGSVIKFTADGDVDTGKYVFNVNGKGIDLEKLTSPLGLPAKISGKVGVALDGNVRSGFTTLIQGNGKFKMRDVVVDEFPGQAAVLGTSPFKIKTGNISINLNDGELYIMPGSAISAPSNDDVYHFVSFTGTAWRQAKPTPMLDEELLPKDLVSHTGDTYHMFIDGSVNVRVLNSVLGGLSAVMEAGESGDLSMENIGSNMLKNMITGGIVKEYRQFYMDIAGKTYDSSPKINKLKFEGTGSYADVADTSWTEDSSSAKTEQVYGISYAIPLGPDPSKIKNPHVDTKKDKKKKKKSSTAEE